MASLLDRALDDTKRNEKRPHRGGSRGGTRGGRRAASNPYSVTPCTHTSSLIPRRNRSRQTRGGTTCTSRTVRPTTRREAARSRSRICTTNSQRLSSPYLHPAPPSLLTLQGPLQDVWSHRERTVPQSRLALRNAHTAHKSLQWGPDDRSTGCASVTFQNELDAERAVKQLNGRMAKQQEITVEFDHDAPTKSKARTGLLGRIERPEKVGFLNTNSRGRGGRGAPRGRGSFSDRGHSGRGAPRGRGSARSGPRKPATQADLDAELDAFMSNDKGKTDASGDVAME